MALGKNHCLLGGGSFLWETLDGSDKNGPLLFAFKKRVKHWFLNFLYIVKISYIVNSWFKLESFFNAIVNTNFKYGIKSKSN